MASHGKRKVPLKVDEVEYNQELKRYNQELKKRKILVLGLEELCKKRKNRYNHLTQFPTLHKFSIVRQIVDDIVKEASDIILYNDLSTTVSIKSSDEQKEVCSLLTSDSLDSSFYTKQGYYL